MRKLSNISLKEYRTTLSRLGRSPVRSKGGHEAWMKTGMTRPVIFQTHVEPIPEFVVRNNLRNIGITKEDFLAILENL